ncbi:WD repeat-containing protein slp1, partial [Spiromyces aspiralis]
MSDVSTKASPYATPLSPRHVPRMVVAKGLKSERVLHRATTRPSSAIGLPLSPKKIVAPATNGGGSSSSGGGGGGAGDRGGNRAKSSLYDRFIPNRSAIDITSSQFNLDQASNTSGGDPMASDAGDNSGATGCLDSNTLAYQEEVARACGVSLNKRILAFSAEAPVSNKEDLRQIYSHRPPLKTTASINNKRRILATPERVLDAPGL